MRRLVRILALAAVVRPVTAQLEAAVAASTTGEVRSGDVVYRYRLLEPPQAARSVPLPLVVFLHGAGERGDDNRRQLTWLPAVLAAPKVRERHPCWVLAVQCPAGEQWVDVPWGESSSRPQPPAPTRAMQAVTVAMERVLADPRVDGARVYLTGLSMGGYGAWDLAQRSPDRFAAVLPVCGGGDERRAGALLGLPVHAVHGADDPVVPVLRSRTMVAALRALGAVVGYDELVGVQHDSWRQAYGDGGALDWLFAQDQRQQRRGAFAAPPLVPMPSSVWGGDGAAATTVRRAAEATVHAGAEPVRRVDAGAADWCLIAVGRGIEVVGRDAAAVQAGAGFVDALLAATPRDRIAAASYRWSRPLREGWALVADEEPWSGTQCIALLRAAWRHGYRGVAGIALSNLAPEDAAAVRAAAAGFGLGLAPAVPAGAVRFDGVTDAAAWLAMPCEGDGPFAVELTGPDTAACTVRLALAAERAANGDAVLHTNSVLARIAPLLRR